MTRACPARSRALACPAPVRPSGGPAGRYALARGPVSPVPGAGAARRPPRIRPALAPGGPAAPPHIPTARIPTAHDVADVAPPHGSAS